MGTTEIERMEDEIVAFGYGIYCLPNRNHAVADPDDDGEGFFIELNDRTELIREAHQTLVEDHREDSDVCRSPESVHSDEANTSSSREPLALLSEAVSMIATLLSYADDVANNHAVKPFSTEDREQAMAILFDAETLSARYSAPLIAVGGEESV